MDKIRYRRGIEAEALLGDHGDETAAGFEIWIVKFTITLIALKVSGIFRREKSALVMIEPPIYSWGTGVLEIDNGVFVAIEMGFVKERAGTMQQSGKNEINILPDAFAVEAGKECSGAGSVKTFVVVKNFDFQSMPQSYKNSRRQQALIERISDDGES